MASSRTWSRCRIRCATTSDAGPPDVCLIGWAWRPGAAVPLWIAANRDEAWDRPAAPLAPWHLPDGTEVLSGRDRLAGGAWLAFGSGGRLAMLTNVRADPQPSVPGARSRGHLVADWLSAAARDLGWREWLRRHPAAAYGGCNLVLVDLATAQWRWLSNVDPRGHDPRWRERELQCVDGWWGVDVPDGVHALSNAALDTPWPKTQALAAVLDDEALLASGRQLAEQALLTALQQPVTVQDDADAERALQRRPWVCWPARRYGTRSSLIAWLDSAGTLHAAEWTYAPGLGPDGIPHASVRRRSIHWCGMPTSS
ncbi:Transport and Golgi organization 2 [Tepidimonas alkaliphilus]|uniref:Transport and Golgi organization 2 n=1 Tax=Tepidimonas alkaliphilus TaxID=2588942 RepID=A0A554WDR4_9BURK|nr:NRDE family protein [Tepidimonas alkaliphilus]TSE21725.1 Transport and Golgi organization 2 [Tepidimonas alkaliphilus]